MYNVNFTCFCINICLDSFCCWKKNIFSHGASATIESRSYFLVYFDDIYFVCIYPSLFSMFVFEVLLLLAKRSKVGDNYFILFIQIELHTTLYRKIVRPFEYKRNTVLPKCFIQFWTFSLHSTQTFKKTLNSRCTNWWCCPVSFQSLSLASFLLLNITIKSKPLSSHIQQSLKLQQSAM